MSTENSETPNTNDDDVMILTRTNVVEFTNLYYQLLVKPNKMRKQVVELVKEYRKAILTQYSRYWDIHSISFNQEMVYFEMHEDSEFPSIDEIEVPFDDLLNLEELKEKKAEVDRLAREAREQAKALQDEEILEEKRRLLKKLKQELGEE